MDKGDALAAILTGIFHAARIDNAKDRLSVWDKCWTENDHHPYFGKVCRVGNEFVDDPLLEKTMFADLRDGLFMQHLGGIREVSEFGCGAGDNLDVIRRSWKVRGFDWSAAAVAKVRARGIEAHPFDMFHPNYDVKLTGAAFTVHAMEQLGANWKPFYKYLLAQKILCLHIEPIVELYDDMNLIDFVQQSYHRKRGYLEGFLPHLHEQAAAKKIELLKVSRSTFGGLYHSAYSVIVWRGL